MGTAHISAESVKEVREVIAREAPAVVAVELDEARYKALTEPEKWKETKLVDVIKQGKAFMLLAQAFLASYQRRLGEKFGVKPGSEMLAAIEEAKARSATLVLADRDIGVTLKRAWARMGLREKFRITWEFMKALTGAAALEEGKAGQEMKPEDLLKEDALSLMMEELSAFAPSVSDVLVKERDAYLAGKIREASAQAGSGKVVAVIGAGHLRGVEAHLQQPEGIPPAASLETIPKKFPWGQAIAWGMFALVVGAMVFLGYQAFVAGQAGCLQKLQDLAIQWVLVTGTFSAIGAAAALAHPASIAVAFISAPFATIHPLIATGWFSGLTEAVVRQPRMQDYEALSQLQQVRDFWRNRVTRVLLVAALTNVGAMIATFWLLPRVLGGFQC
ncbi:MAG TPA: TraB/GumN family protein [Candidatus Thermoplasmatota archaeon]|nr:TraB/GumN family protein [Candidatus Thermoplasmatota archaeon]